MTLRWRLALALALLAGLATAATASIAYSNTGDRLYHEVDRFLEERLPMAQVRGRTSLAAELSEHGPGQILGPRGFPLGGGLRRGGQGGQGTQGTPVYPPATERTPAGSEFAPRDDTIVQVVLADGTVAARTSEVELPLSPAEHALATGTGSTAPILRTVTVAGTPYRVRTVSWSGGGAIQVARDTTDVQRVLSDLRWRFVAVGLSVMGAALVAGWFIARQTSAPLRRLTGAAEQVARTGDLAIDVPTTGSDETGRLARAFATMLAALARSKAEQTQLVQDASHELRTPLTSLRTNIEVLERHPDLPPASRTALLGDLRSELDELSSLVGELVQLASFSRDDEPAVALSLGELCQRAGERATRRHGRPVLVNVVAGRSDIVVAQRSAIDRAVSNLLDNAAKFGAPDTSAVEVTVDGGRVAVRDHGPGIPPEDLPKIFDRFYRSASARQLPGSGLGLAIVAQVVAAHAGNVFAANDPDGGAVVGFELPPPAMASDGG